MALRFSLVAGGAGFVGGLLCGEWRRRGVVGAATSVEDSPPMEGGVVARTMQLGFPGLDTIRSRRSYVLSYDRRNRVPHWVLEHLTPDKIAHNGTVGSRSTLNPFQLTFVGVKFNDEK